VEHVDELIGVYDADATLIGEVSYWIGARLGIRHCALCDLTHGLFTRKSEWTQCTRALAVPFSTYHRNDAPADVLVAADGAMPVVLARRGDDLRIVLSPLDLEQFDGSTADFVDWVTDFLGRPAEG
jgi:hypothetical protein